MLVKIKNARFSDRISVRLNVRKLRLMIIDASNHAGRKNQSVRVITINMRNF